MKHNPLDALRLWRLAGSVQSETRHQPGSDADSRLENGGPDERQSVVERNWFVRHSFTVLAWEIRTMAKTARQPRAKVVGMRLTESRNGVMFGNGLEDHFIGKACLILLLAHWEHWKAYLETVVPTMIDQSAVDAEKERKRQEYLAQKAAIPSVSVPGMVAPATGSPVPATGSPAMDAAALQQMIAATVAAALAQQLGTAPPAPSNTPPATT